MLKGTIEDTAEEIIEESSENFVYRALNKKDYDRY